MKYQNILTFTYFLHIKYMNISKMMGVRFSFHFQLFKCHFFIERVIDIYNTKISKSFMKPFSAGIFSGLFWRNKKVSLFGKEWRTSRCRCLPLQVVRIDNSTGTNYQTELQIPSKYETFPSSMFLITKTWQACLKYKISESYILHMQISQ